MKPRLLVSIAFAASAALMAAARAQEAVSNLDLVGAQLANLR